MTFSLKSRHFDKDYAPKVKLLDVLSHRYTPLMGTTLYDDAANFSPVREYRTITADFPEVCAYVIKDAFITNEFIVHDHTSIYPDSSLIFFESGGSRADQMMTDLASSILRVPGPIDESHVSDEVVVMHNEGGGTWGHHIVHNLPRILLYLKHNPDCKIALPGSHGYYESNFGAILKLYGIKREQLVLMDNLKTYRFKSVIIVDFLYTLTKVSRILRQSMCLEILRPKSIK